MIDLTTLPVRLAPIFTDAGPVKIIRAHHKYALAFNQIVNPVFC